MSSPVASHHLHLTPHIMIDFDQETIQHHDRNIVLPARTWRLLQHLVNQPNRVVSDTELLAQVWPGEAHHTPADLYRQRALITNAG